MTVKRLDPREELAVVPARDQNLGVGACCGLQEGQGTRGHFMFLHESDLIFTRPESVGACLKKVQSSDVIYDVIASGISNRIEDRKSEEDGRRT